MSSSSALSRDILPWNQAIDSIFTSRFSPEIISRLFFNLKFIIMLSMTRRKTSQEKEEGFAVKTVFPPFFLNWVGAKVVRVKKKLSQKRKLTTKPPSVGKKRANPNSDESRSGARWLRIISRWRWNGFINAFKGWTVTYGLSEEILKYVPLEAKNVNLFNWILSSYLSIN